MASQPSSVLGPIAFYLRVAAPTKGGGLQHILPRWAWRKGVDRKPASPGSGVLGMGVAAGGCRPRVLRLAARFVRSLKVGPLGGSLCSGSGSGGVDFLTWAHRETELRPRRRATRRRFRQKARSALSSQAEEQSGGAGWRLVYLPASKLGPECLLSWWRTCQAIQFGERGAEFLAAEGKERAGSSAQREHFIAFPPKAWPAGYSAPSGPASPRRRGGESCAAEQLVNHSGKRLDILRAHVGPGGRAVAAAADHRLAAGPRLARR